MVDLEVPKVINQFSITNEQSNDDGVTNNKTVNIAKDNTNASETDVVGFQNREEQEKSFDDLTTFSTSSISDLTDFSYIDSSSYNSTVQRNGLEKSFSINATEDESDVDEAIQDEDFSFLIDYDREKIDDCDNFTNNSDEFEASPSTDRPNSYNILSGIIEKSSVANILDNQSDIEVEMIIMFNREINAFPNYRSHTLGVETTSRTHYDGEIINTAVESVV